MYNIVMKGSMLRKILNEMGCLNLRRAFSTLFLLRETIPQIFSFLKKDNYTLIKNLHFNFLYCQTVFLDYNLKPVFTYATLFDCP